MQLWKNTALTSVAALLGLFLLPLAVAREPAEVPEYTELPRTEQTAPVQPAVKAVYDADRTLRVLDGETVREMTLADYLVGKGLPFRTAYKLTGSLVAFETGEACSYGLFNAQERGTLFIGPGVKVYSGMIVGQSAKPEDIELNVCKTKKLTNTRSSSADDALRLSPPRILSLEQALDFIDTDELLEVTPKSLRIRKKILDHTMRKRAAIQNK